VADDLKEHPDGQKSKADYAEAVKQLLTAGDRKAAFDIVKKALKYYPSDLFFLSYYGYLLAAVEGQTKDGAKICSEAITTLRKTMPADMEFFYPLFYLNLGRAYLEGARKKEALRAFQEGLKFDPKSEELLSEVKGLGLRKKPVISFLDRSNTVNIRLGRLRQRLWK